MHGKVCHKMFKKISKQNYNDANDVFWVFEILSLPFKNLYNSKTLYNSKCVQPN